MSELSLLVTQIKSQVSLPDLISRRVSLRKQGAGFIGLCPFHEEKTPSFHVRESPGRFKCFGCGASGDAIDFIMRLRGISFNAAVDELSQGAGIISKQENKNKYEDNSQKKLIYIQQSAHKFFINQLWGTAGLGAREYLVQQRGLSSSMIRQAQIGFGGSNTELLSYLRKQNISQSDACAAGILRVSPGGLVSVFAERIIFPIYSSQDHLVAFGGRKFLSHDDGPKYVNTKSYKFFEKAKVFFGLKESRNFILKGHSLVIVEGYFDAMALWAAGYPAVCVCGTALTKYHVEQVKNLTKKVIILFDRDRAGMEALKKGLLEFIRKNIFPKTVELSFEDPGEYLALGKISNLKNSLNNSVDALCFLLDREALKAVGTVENRIGVLINILPIISAISNLLIKRQYVSYFAQAINEDPSIIWGQLKNNSSKSKLVKKEINNFRQLNLTSSQQLLLQLICNFPSLVISIKTKSFANYPDGLKNWLLELQVYIDSHENITRDNLRSMAKNHGESISYLVNLVLGQECLYNLAQAQEILGALINKQKQEGRLQKRQKLNLELAQAQKSGDFEQIKIILKKSSNLLAKKSDYKNNKTNKYNKIEPILKRPITEKESTRPQGLPDEEDWL